MNIIHILIHFFSQPIESMGNIGTASGNIVYGLTM